MNSFKIPQKIFFAFVLPILILVATEIYFVAKIDALTTAEQILLVSIVFVVPFSIFMAYVLNKSILRQVKYLSQATKKIAEITIATISLFWVEKFSNTIFPLIFQCFYNIQSILYYYLLVYLFQSQNHTKLQKKKQ